MSGRDYKRSNGRAKGGGRAPGSWVSFVSGLGIGLVVAVAFYFSDGRWPGLTTREAPPPAAPSGEAAPAAPEATPEARPATEPTAELPAPKFDFYKILPEIEVSVPESELADEKESAADAAAEPESPVASAPAAAAYVLQVGAFQRFEDADQVKAQLALQGVQATIQRVVINGQEVWHRVHVGPFAAVSQAQAMRARLLQIGMQPIVLRIGG